MLAEARLDEPGIDLHIEELAGVHEGAPERRDKEEDEENRSVLACTIGTSQKLGL